MKQVANKLAGFIKQDVVFKLSEDEFFEGTTYEIYEKGSEELLGICVLDSDNRLVNYHFLGVYEKGPQTTEDMPTIAESFIRALYPNGLEQYTLQTVVDLDDVFMVLYGTKDERFELELPGIGFSLTISTSGQVVQFSYDEEPVEIFYPDTMLSEEEAKSRYASLLDFELIIRRTDKEIYANGDNTYRLVYSVKEAAVDIPASGESPVHVAEGNQYERIQQQDAPSTSLYELIGVTANHVKIGELIEDGVRIEKWIHSSIERPAEVDFEEAYSDQFITIHFDMETNIPTMVYNGELWQGGEERLDETTQRQRALDFLFKVFPQANECFLKELEEPEEEWSDDEDHHTDDDIELEMEEESTPFYFQYHVQQVPVEESVTCIQVGVHSGNIISASVEPIDEVVLRVIQTIPAITKQDARARLMQKLRMELSMAHEYDEEGKPFYQPVYLPSFPETVGHVQMIDAVNGKAYYVDVGETLFF